MWHLRNQQDQKGHDYLLYYDLPMIGTLSTLRAEMSQDTRKNLLRSSQFTIRTHPFVLQQHLSMPDVKAYTFPGTFHSSFVEVPVSFKTYIEVAHFFLGDLYFVIGMSVMQRVRKRFFFFLTGSMFRLKEKIDLG